MRRFVLGTAGHVDHGKTTLVRALTGVDTDRLPEEKRRGITIELGFAPWYLDDATHVSIVDVPGHRRLVHTMIAGAIGIELVLIVVAADEGVMPQTREHVAACQLLGIRRAVVAVTKIDRVEQDLAQLAGEEALELLPDDFAAEVVLCSAKTGEGLDALRVAVRKNLAALGPARSSSRARLSVDRAFSIRGAGTVVTGTLVEGSIAVGDALRLVGERGAIDTTARGLHVHDASVAQAHAPARLAINLGGVTLDDVHRGDVVTNDPAAAATRMVDVTLSGSPGKSGSLHVGTARSLARIERLGEAGDRARLRLSKPVVALGGDRFVLRGSDVDGPSGAVCGGGTVLDASPPPRKSRPRRLAVLEALCGGDPSSALRALVAEAAPRALERATLASRFSMESTVLERAADHLVERGVLAVVRARGEGPARARPTAGWTSVETLAAVAARARALVAEHHVRAPLDRGLGRETLRQGLAARHGAELAEEAIRLATTPSTRIEGDPIVVEGDVLRSASGGPALSSRASDSIATATRAISEAGLKGMTEHGIGTATGAAPKDVKAILAKLVREGAAIHAGELWFSAASVAGLRAKVIAHLASTPRLTIAAFKELSGLGRKQAIVLLEELDRTGVTKREGDDRVRGKSA